MDQTVKSTKLRVAKEVESVYGKGFYRTHWKNLSIPKKILWTLRGHNPGGRAGAPTFEEVES